MRSLRVRLFLVAAIVIVVALTVVGFLMRRAARMEFRVYEVAERSASAQTVAQALSQRLATEPEPGQERLREILVELARTAGHDLVLVGPEGRIHASSAEPGVHRVRVDGNGRVTVIGSERHGRMVEQRRVMFMSDHKAQVRLPNGSTLGMLIVLPAAGHRPGFPSAPFGGAFDMRLLLAAGAAGIVALALSWALSRRLLGPVEALTAATQRLGRGDLEARVPVRGKDELAELSRAFNTMAGDLARQESLRRTLVTDVAHELRSPLTNLRGQIEAVEDGLLPASPETLRSLREEVLLLARLVDDLQTLSVAEAGRLALDRSAVQIRDLVDGALESMTASAAERGIVLRNHVGDLPAVSADPTRIGQVLRNLLGNAARYTPAGGSIEVSGTTEDRFVSIAVADSGPGIAPEHLPHVFERFYRADPSRARATGGAGLGLAIVKGIVEAHEGTVSVASEPGRGATFRFTLPTA